MSGRVYKSAPPMDMGRTAAAMLHHHVQRRAQRDHAAPAKAKQQEDREECLDAAVQMISYMLRLRRDSGCTFSLVLSMGMPAINLRLGFRRTDFTRSTLPFNFRLPCQQSLGGWSDEG